MLRLNLGSGADIREGYQNIDIRNLPNINVVADIQNLPYRKGSIDEILAIDILEHISYRETVNVLKKWADLLKVGGSLIIQMPCLDTIIKFLIESKTLGDIEWAIELLFGGQDYKENSHFTTAHVLLMTAYLEQVGMTEIHHSLRGYNVIFKCKKGQKVL